MIRSESLTAVWISLEMLSHKFSFLIVSITFYDLSKTVIDLLISLLFIFLKIDEPIKPQPIIVIFSNIKLSF